MLEYFDAMVGSLPALGFAVVGVHMRALGNVGDDLADVLAVFDGGVAFLEVLERDLVADRHIAPAVRRKVELSWVTQHSMSVPAVSPSTTTTPTLSACSCTRRCGNFRHGFCLLNYHGFENDLGCGDDAPRGYRQRPLGLRQAAAFRSSRARRAGRRTSPGCGVAEILRGVGVGADEGDFLQRHAPDIEPAVAAAQADMTITPPGLAMGRGRERACCGIAHAVDDEIELLSPSARPGVRRSIRIGLEQIGSAGGVGFDQAFTSSMPCAFRLKARPQADGAAADHQRRRSSRDAARPRPAVRHASRRRWVRPARPWESRADVSGTVTRLRSGIARSCANPLRAAAWR
jgi:hypothetical protein